MTEISEIAIHLCTYCNQTYTDTPEMVGECYECRGLDDFEKEVIWNEKQRDKDAKESKQGSHGVRDEGGVIPIKRNVERNPEDETT